jgi:hypothetical protein
MDLLAVEREQIHGGVGANPCRCKPFDGVKLEKGLHIDVFGVKMVYFGNISNWVMLLICVDESILTNIYTNVT